MLPIFLSSDYVFDGTAPIGCVDDAPLCPTTEYGRQKAEVEQALAASGKPHLVCRLSKTYGLDRGDGTLLDEIAGKLSTGQSFSAAFDQRFCPTFAGDLPAAIMELQAREAARRRQPVRRPIVEPLRHRSGGGPSPRGPGFADSADFPGPAARQHPAAEKHVASSGAAAARDCGEVHFT